MAEKIRPAAVAGTFYPAGAAELKHTVEQLVARANPPSALLKKAAALRALVVPHAGYVYSGSVAANGYSMLKAAAAKRKISRIILLGPPHTFPVEGAALSSAAQWKTPLGTVKLAAAELSADTFVTSDLAHKDEHCIEVQLPFLQEVLKDFEIVPILLGEIEPEEIARALLPLINEETFVIASSDLSHYHSYDEAVKLDVRANKAVPSGDTDSAESVEACGRAAILVLMHIAKLRGWRGSFVAYANSGDTTGGRAEVVGYGCYAFFGEK